MLAPSRKLAILLLLPAALLADCVNFPPALVPFSTISYVTAADFPGDHLVVGTLAGGLNTLAQIPLPTSTNQVFCDSQVQLAAQQFYPNVYVPTAAERSGNFAAFSGLLLNPANNQPFPGGIIPPAQLGQVFAFRIAAAQPVSALRGWSPTSQSPRALFRTPAILLPSGKVFVPATTAGDPSLSYDPSTGAFQNLATPLYAHGNFVSATLLDNGLILLAGGQTTPSNAELYDPSADKFTALPQMVQGHAADFTATKLKDGRVLIIGGPTNPMPPFNYAGAELFDPLTKTFSSTGPVLVTRDYQTATLLADGRVLVAGGVNGSGILNEAEIYDPVSGKFTAAATLVGQRFGAEALRLPNGKVLIVGGYNTGGSAELYDPSTGTFSFAGYAHYEHADGGLVLLSSGQVLSFGGGDPHVSTALAETYNPTTGVFALTGSMSLARYSFSSALLPDGRVLVIGGAPDAGQNASASSEIYTPTTQGLVASQTGLTFRAAQSSAASASQTIAVLSPTDTIPWTTSVKTFSGGNWLSVTPANGNSAPGAAAVPLTITVNPTGLAAQDYYGSVTIAPTDQTHPPISVVVVFSVVPAGTPAPLTVSPNGQLFSIVAGASAQPQAFKISNATSAAINFTGTASANAFFDFNPKSGTVTSALPAVITVTPASATLPQGVYRGSIKLAFSDGSSQTVDVLLVIGPGGRSSSSSLRGASACASTKLQPVITSLGAGFTAPVAWPAPLIVQVVDDCGFNSLVGQVVASFTNGDPPLSLTSIGGGVWTGTWVPVRNSAGTVVRIDAQNDNGTLRGTVQISGNAVTNPKVPVVAAGGVLSTGDYNGSPALGLLVSIFGSALADGVASNASLPLPTQLGSTTVLLSGAQLPLLYVSDSQVNVLVPYNLAVNAPHQIVVQRGNAISVPVPITITNSQPAILATNSAGSGQGVIFKISSDGITQTLADANSPATAGSVLVIYCVGLGAVTPAIKGGDPSPSSPLASVPVPVSVTIGGQTANSFFAGLTPGFAGLYQINVVVPPGIAAGSQVPVTISVAGKSSSGNIFIAVQ